MKWMKEMRLRMRKWWQYILIIILLGLLWFRMSIKNQEFDRTREAIEQATVSQLSVCTGDGKSLIKQENTSLYVVPRDLKKIYICGLLQSSTSLHLGIYLSKSGADKPFTSSGSMLKPGPFVMDLISTSALNGGEYRADIYIFEFRQNRKIPYICRLMGMLN